MNYEDMIDLDINANVTALEYGCGDWEFNGVEFYHCGIDGSGYFSQPVIDYCNDWAYGGLIIQSKKINLLCDKESTEWEAQAIVTTDMFDPRTYEHYYYDKNPLRAAMIVCLMMSEDKK